MKGLAHWHRQGSRRNRRLLAIRNAPPSGRGASRASNCPCLSFGIALNRCSRSAGHEPCGVAAIVSARRVVLVQAGPRCAWRCSNLSWRAPRFVERGAYNWQCCSLGKRSGSSVTALSFGLRAQHIIEPGTAESVAPSSEGASFSAVAPVGAYRYP